MNPAYTSSASAEPETGIGSAKVSDLDSKHAYWSNNNDLWTMLDLLYRGGQAIQSQGSRFLIKRPKEVTEVYTARLARFIYQNIMGTALGWYQSTLFRKDPTIEMRKMGNDDPDALSDDAKKPYTDFLQNCDRNGTTYIDLWRQVFLYLILFKGAYVCIDLPRLASEPANLAQQRAAGGLDPYLMIYQPSSVINWDVDEFGNFLWVVIKVQTTKREFLGDGSLINRWYYYDRTGYRIYEQKKVQPRDSNIGSVILYAPNGQQFESGDQQTAKLVGQGPHALSEAQKVPVRYFTIPEGLWLANRAYLPSISHLNLENTYQWALEMANLPVPVITTDTEMIHTVSETAAIVLDKGGKFEWSEPKGTSFQHSAARLESIREEIYRSLWLMSQGRSSSASASAASGYSKEMDAMPSKDVLAAFGDTIRAGGQSLLQDVALARGDDTLEFDVRGLNFEINPALQEAETAEIMISIDIPSNTLVKEMQKRVAHAYLTDANRTVIQTVDDEIDKAPTRDEIAAQQQQQLKLSMDRQLGRGVQAVAGAAEQADPAT